MYNGEVSDFFGADFGCIPISPPPIQVGVYVETRGRYEPLPDPHVVAREIIVTSCDDDTIPRPIDPAAVGCNEGALRGVVTEVIRPLRRVDVMGTAVYFPNQVPVDIYPGMRIEVRVTRAGNVGAWVVAEWHPWGEEFDAVDGRVDDVVTGSDGVLRILVVDTWVVPAHILAAGR
jgi:hypothetical protein